MVFSEKNKYISPWYVYKVLLKQYGPQGWWPVTKPGEFVPGYHNSKKVKSRREMFEVAVGAILTQNTSWKNVERAIENLNRAKLLSCEKIHGIEFGKLTKLIRPSGYYNQKARRLKIFAAHVMNNYGGDIKKMFGRPKEKLRKELLSINGIGPETADSMILYAGQKPLFVADNYTLRLGIRLGWFDEKTGYEAAARYCAARLPGSAEIYGELHALIVALGKDHCRKKPLCAGCRVDCLYGRKK
jgi:endonuclease III related protein